MTVLRAIPSLLALLTFLLCSGLAAAAAPRDKAAQKKIEEAIYTHFLNTDFDQAEGLLLGTIRACEDKCSPALLAKAWMYVGVVRGSGRNDMAGAGEAFATAITTDPNVALDNEIASDPVKAAFAKASGGGGAATPPPSGEAASAGFACKPTPTELETRRPFPMECEAEVDLPAAKLHYKAFGTGWTSLKMEQNQGSWRATIPCAALGNTGKLKYYVEGLDADKAVAVAFGSKDAPREVDIVSESSADPPAFPEEEPPARCSIDQMGEPPTSGGGGPSNCGGWGEPCGEGDCCKSGFTCSSGTCESATKCETDADCEGGTCSDGTCGGGEGDKAAGPGAKNWVTLGFALDIASISSDKACARASRADHIACFYSNGATYPGEPNAQGAGKIKGGFAPSTMRVLAGFERLFGPIGLEARLGFAFNGGKTPEGGTAFFPVHAEARGKFWILGAASLAKPGVRPWVHLGGGMAQVDATVTVEIADCGNEVTNACLQAPTVTEALQQGGTKAKLQATKQLGQSFATAGGGIMYAIGANHGALLNVNFMIPFPSTGFVLEPSIGYAVGF